MVGIYVAKNKLMPGFCKIGASENAKKRVDGLYGAWEVAHAWEMPIDRARYYESETKHKLRSFAVVGYELFNCPIKYLEETINNIISYAKEIELPNDAVIVKASAKDIGMLIRQSRKAQHLTIMECSGLTKIGYRFISNIENGKETAQIGKVIALLDGLGVKLYAHYQK